MTVLKIAFLLLFGCAVCAAQTAGVNTFSKDGLSFNYPAGWSIQDESNSDAQTIKLARSDADIQLTVFVHRGRISADKMVEAQKDFITPYVDATAKQFVDNMGAKVQRTPDSTEIGGVKAEGTKLKFIVSGDSATSQIYWALVNQRVVILTYFGPDRDRQKFLSSWETVKTTLKIEDAKPVAKPTPKHSAQARG